MKHRRSKACDISPAVKKAVWERDGGRCILCGSFRDVMPNAHFISRAHGGLGVPENIMTLCRSCHDRFDNGGGELRKAMRERAWEYLKTHHEHWNEEALVYRKYDF